MERGKLCNMTEKEHYNLQAWHEGKNEVRYVREEDRDAVEEAIEGYKLFSKLAVQYSDEIIQKTRRGARETLPKEIKDQNR